LIISLAILLAYTFGIFVASFAYHQYLVSENRRKERALAERRPQQRQANAEKPEDDLGDRR